jgi:hypothetical protein
LICLNNALKFFPEFRSPRSSLTDLRWWVGAMLIASRELSTNAGKNLPIVEGRIVVERYYDLMDVIRKSRLSPEFVH